MGRFKLPANVKSVLDGMIGVSQLFVGELVYLTDIAKIAVVTAPTAYKTLLTSDDGDTYALKSKVRDVKYRAGTWISAAQSSLAPTTLGLSTSIRAFPFWVDAEVTVNSIKTEVTTLAAGSTYRTALYRDNGFNYPGAIVAGTDVGTNDGATTGQKTQTPVTPIVLAPGLYWLAVQASATLSIRAIAVGAISPVLGYSGNLGTNSALTCWTFVGTYGPLPSVFPTGATLAANTACPLVIYRVV